MKGQGEGSNLGWSRIPNGTPERHLRVNLTDRHGSQALERINDWRAGRSRGRLREQIRSMEEQEGAEGELEGNGVGAKQHPLCHQKERPPADSSTDAT